MDLPKDSHHHSTLNILKTFEATLWGCVSHARQTKKPSGSAEIRKAF
ncbi:conserved hypothetical protein [delta proteobacterium NaphS2]|nr:conserved hypothetical protein [delta proteobacterium NaphS2]